MIVRKSGTKLTLYRYGGTSDGRNLEVRVGSCPAGISPESIPQELMDDLTPKELKVLRDVLAKDQQAILKEKISAVVGDLNDLSSAIESGLLDDSSVEELRKAASAMVKSARRGVVVKKVGNVGSSTS